MKKQAISIILSLCFSIMLCAQEQFSTSIFFETANAELTDLSKKELDNLTTQLANYCLLYTSPSPRDRTRSRMPSSA